MATTTYQYSVRDRAGKLITGTLEGESQTAVVQKLRGMGYAPVSINEAKTGMKTEITIPGFGKKVKLKDLAVRNPSCRVSLPLLRDAKELTSLHVQGRIVVDELRFLAECAKLQKLTLQVEPPLQDADLIWLHGLQQLRTLYVGGDAITANGRDALKAALPKCTMKSEQW
jgi:hypothetical protein